MIHLDTFRLLGKHVVGILAGFYIAGAAARLISVWWPAARPFALIIVSLFFTFVGLSLMIRELNKGKLSTGIIILDFLPILLVGICAVLLFGEFVGRYWSDAQGIINFIGIYFWVGSVLAGAKQTIQDRNLKEDLEKSPNELLRRE